ncbi:hypothetical protein TNCV_3600051 [Trichonephila clavipes]|nr:hypothetical protein TNCV_3600051 [Trichonephila clavipes]
MRARAYSAHPNVRDHWALSCMNRCPDQMVSLKRDSQCLSPQANCPQPKDRTSNLRCEILSQAIEQWYTSKTTILKHKKRGVGDKTYKFSDEAHFWLNGYLNKQNCRIWSEANPQVYVETPLHPEKLTVWCALWAGGILLQKR